MTKRNLTIQVDDEVVRRARLLAARRSTSISGLVAQQLEQLVLADAAYQSARREAVEAMTRGYPLGGGALPTRDQVHDR